MYLCFTALVTAPFLLDLYVRLSGNFTLFYLLGCVLLSVWISYPRYKSRFLRWASLCLTGVAVGNVVVGAGRGLIYGEDFPTYPANLRIRLRFTPGYELPGITGDQIFTTDPRGYRTNKPIDYGNKGSNTLRIVAIGASTTADSMLDDGKTWTHVMGAEIERSTGKPVEIINMGVNGVRAEHSYRALLAAQSLNPDIVTFVLGINDWNHAIRMENQSWLHQRVFKWRTLGFTNSPVYTSLKHLQSLLGEALRARNPEELLYFYRDFKVDAADSLSRPQTRSHGSTTIHPEYGVWLDRILAECRDKKIACVFGDQPTAYSSAITPDLRKRLWMTPAYADYTLSLENMSAVAALYNRWTVQRVQHYGQTMCLLSPLMPPSTEVFYDDCHFNEEGARRIGDAMAKCVLKKLGAASH